MKFPNDVTWRLLVLATCLFGSGCVAYIPIPVDPPPGYAPAPSMIAPMFDHLQAQEYMDV
jgi:hypothetical protein